MAKDVAPGDGPRGGVLVGPNGCCKRWWTCAGDADDAARVRVGEAATRLGGPSENAELEVEVDADADADNDDASLASAPNSA